MYAGATLWGAAFGPLIATFATGATRLATRGADLVQACVVTVFNVGIAIGSLGGGVLLTALGVPGLTWVALGLLAFAFAAIVAARGPAFAAPDPARAAYAT